MCINSSVHATVDKTVQMRVRVEGEGRMWHWRILTLATLAVADCDYRGHQCADGLACGVDNCQEYHPDFDATTDCCEPGEVTCVCPRLASLCARYVVRRVARTVLKVSISSDNRIGISGSGISPWPAMISVAPCSSSSSPNPRNAPSMHVCLRLFYLTWHSVCSCIF